MQTLSLCMIVRDAAHTLGRTLASVKSLASEIIIVDTGSTDETLDIARLYTTHIYHYQWDNHFAKARNFALERATSQWILVLDADEWLPDSTYNAIKDFLHSPTHTAVSFLIHNSGSTSHLAYTLIRLWANDQRIRYSHRVHEVIDPSFFATFSDSDLYFSDWTIIHDGYQDPLPEKLKRNTDLLAAYTEEEKDSYYYYLIGRDAFFKEDYALCLDAFNQAVRQPNQIRGQLTYMFLLRMYALFYLKNYPLVIQFCNQALSLTPNFRELYLLLAMSYTQLGHIQAANQARHHYEQLPIDDVHFPRLMS